MLEAVSLVLLAAVISVDTTAFAQFMISRPIVCAPIFGYILGDVKTGLWIGMIIELMWIKIIPMGAAVPKDTTSIAILSTIWGLKTFPGVEGAMVLAMVIAVPAGILFKQLDILLRYYNVRIVHWVEEGVVEGKESRISYGIYFGIFLFFIKALFFYAVLIYPGQWLLMKVFPMLPAEAVSGLQYAWKLLPLAGLGLLMVSFHRNKLPHHK